MQRYAMRNVLALATLSLFTLIPGTPARESDPAILCQDSTDSMACADLVEPRILAGGDLARRQGATLTLPLQEDRALSFVDGEPAPGAREAAHDVRYRLYAHVTHAGLWIVLGRWTDGERWYVVDRGAGTVADFAGIPHISPDGTRVAESPSWTSPGGRGLRVWRLAYPAPVLEFSAEVAEDPLSLEPAFAALKWKGDDALAFLWQVPVEDCAPSCYRNAPGRLTRTRGGWRLDGMPEGWPESVRLDIDAPGRSRSDGR